MERRATIEKAQACLRNGTIMAFAPYSAHPDDDYLAVVLVCRGSLSYVVWTFNSELGGFANGLYTQNLRAGLADFTMRIHE